MDDTRRARVVIRKARPIKRKTVVGPLLRLSTPGTALLLSIVAPSPLNWRVEPHIVWDPEGDLEGDKLSLVTGTLFLARHEGLAELMEEGLKSRVYPSYHLAPWGVPVITEPLTVDEPDEALKVALYELGAWRVHEWAKKELVPKLEIVIE